MRRTILVLFVVVLALSLAVGPAPAAPKGNAANGKALYAKSCTTCHGAAGEPKEALAKMLKVTIRHLGSKEVQARSDDEIQAAILKGTGKMKPVKDVDEKQAADLVAHLRTLAQK